MKLARCFVLLAAIGLDARGQVGSSTEVAYALSYNSARCSQAPCLDVIRLSDGALVYSVPFGASGAYGLTQGQYSLLGLHQPIVGDARLVTINEPSGTVSGLGEVGLKVPHPMIERDPVTGDLYLLRGVPGGADLYIIDAQTGASNFVAPLSAPVSFVASFAIHPSGTGFVSNGVQLYTFDLSNGVASRYGTLSGGVAGIFTDLAFDSTGRLYGTFEAGNNSPFDGVWTADLSTMTLTQLTHGDVLGIAVGSACLAEGYCTSKTGSLGCTPAIEGIGLAKLGATSGFEVRATGVRNRRVGILIHGSGQRAALPFQGGTLCFAPPVERGPIADSGGTPLPAADCSGVWSVDFNAYLWGLVPAADDGSPAPALPAPGTVVRCQWWGRDAPGSSALSDALEFTLCP